MVHVHAILHSKIRRCASVARAAQRRPSGPRGVSIQPIYSFFVTSSSPRAASVVCRQLMAGGASSAIVTIGGLLRGDDFGRAPLVRDSPRGDDWGREPG